MPNLGPGGVPGAQGEDPAPGAQVTDPAQTAVPALDALKLGRRADWAQGCPPAGNLAAPNERLLEGWRVQGSTELPHCPGAAVIRLLDRKKASLQDLLRQSFLPELKQDSKICFVQAR